jgi:PhoH-like ATPase
MATRRTAAAPARSSRKSSSATKLFVLDTNVLMHDPTSLFRFEEHDIFVPIMTLEELDNNKKGMTEVARNARQVSRLLDEIVSACGRQHRAGHSARHRIERHGQRPPAAADRSDRRRAADRPADRQGGQPDHRGGDAPAERHPGRRSSWCRRTSTCASRPARWAAAQDYFNDKVLEDTDMLYTGTRELPAEVLGRARRQPRVVEGKRPHATTGSRGRCAADLLINEFVYPEAATSRTSRSTRLVRERSGKTAVSRR